MEAYDTIQLDASAAMTRARTNFKKSPKERISLAYIEVRLENLDKQWASFNKVHQDILQKIKNSDYIASQYYKANVYQTTEDIYFDYKTELKEKFQTMKSQVSNQPSTAKASDKSCDLKLPKITLPIFSGNYSEWISFRDLFISLIHNNSKLDDVQKLHYLKTHLSGEAEGLLRHIPITSSNYTTCWSQLESRYNNTKYLANCILKRFMSQKNIVTESSNALKELLDTSNECLHALTNLGIDIATWDIIIIYILSLKLDNESRKQWELTISDTSNKLPSFKQFQSFIEQRFRALEFLDNDRQRNVTVQRNVSSVKTHQVSATFNCSYCQETHKIANCKKFSQQDVDTRRNFVQTNGLCFNCLGVNHTVYACRQSTRCRLCKKKHHTLLHSKIISNSVTQEDTAVRVIEKDVTTAVSINPTQSESTDIVSCFSNNHSQVLLATALVDVHSRNGTVIVLRSLLDQGSQASFVTESMVQLLGLEKIPIKGKITGIGGDPCLSLTSNAMVVIQVQSRVDPSFVVTVKAYVLKKLTNVLPEKKVRTQILTTISSMELADPSFATPNKIDLLLGAEVYGQIILEGLIKGPPGYAVAQNTKFGWILSGLISEQSNHSESRHNCISLHLTHQDDIEVLKKFWELESEPTCSSQRMLSPEETQCETLFSATTKRDKSGRYVVKLPFRSSDPSCKYSGSRAIALKRFFMLERRFMKNPDLQKQYSEVINEYLTLNHMEVVKDIDKEDAVYLPHHAVIRNDKSTTKLRIVFDASCVGTNGKSLNSDLMVGPTLQPELRHIIMRWRCHPICLSADIIKMYRQVKISDDDVDYLRILWRESPDLPIQHLRHLRVTFGTSSAPYLAVRSLHQLASDEGLNFPLIKNTVLSEFYMDDLMSGCQSVSEGLEKYQQLTEMLNRGGFQLQKWTSNSEQLLELIKDSKLETEGNLEIKTDTISKILGLMWNKQSDEFEYTVHLPELEPPITKRKVISDIARLFDPLGWIAPAITTAKVFIQRLWLSGIEWDEELPSQLLKDWIAYRNDLCKLTKFRIPRWIHLCSDSQFLELHGFSDASHVAYSAVIYSRVIASDGKIYVNLVTSKTKIAPIKQISIPRLELCGAVLLAKLLQETAAILKVPKQHLHAWSDSEIVLAWLAKHPSHWKVFIANRVSEILDIVDSSQWSYVPSKENPADCASRGTRPSECDDLLIWKNGPLWLQNEKIIYTRGKIEETNLEERKRKIKCHFTDTEEGGDSILSRFSKFQRLVRVIAFCRRFLQSSKSRNKELKSTWLTTRELNESILTCVKLCQNQSFSEDINQLTCKGKVSKRSKLTALNPFLDDEGILRVGGRLQQAPINDNMKHPILIPYKSHFTNLLVAEAHEKTLHGGPQLMLNYLRSKYWIINARTLVRHYVHKCISCIRHSGKPNQQMMGQLPKSRVTAGKPFQSSGVDYAGPINIRATKGRGYHSTKGYICLFICMATRAIHLEVVNDMTAQSFLAAFKRFVARRGRVLNLWSDNGTTFVGSAKELKTLFNAEKLTVTPEIADFLSINGTNWHFIPPHAPNFGGLWEAGIKSTKHHLKRVIGNSTLTFEEMITVLSQIEACLNSRPISQLPSTPDEVCPLTPGHFLVGEPLVTVPDFNYEDANISSLKRWHLTQRMVQDFWRRWSLEYLTQMQHRYKWSANTPEPKIGDVVLVKEDGLPPARWLYGLVVKKHPGLDNVTRVVSIKCNNNEIKRPVSKLIPLPVTT